MPVLNFVVAVLRDRLLLLSLLVERFVLTLINEDYYYYYDEALFAINKGSLTVEARTHQSWPADVDNDEFLFADLYDIKAFRIYCYHHVQLVESTWRRLTSMRGAADDAEMLEERLRRLLPCLIADVRVASSTTRKRCCLLHWLRVVVYNSLIYSCYTHRIYSLIFIVDFYVVASLKLYNVSSYYLQP